MISDPEAKVGNVRSDILKRLSIWFRDDGIEISSALRENNNRCLSTQP